MPKDKSIVGSVLSILTPTLVESQKSDINSSIGVYKFLGTYRIVVDNLTQSGGLVKSIWHKVVDHLIDRDFQNKSPNNILILGLGAGSAAQECNFMWPSAKITGIEIDPVMIELGQKYFRLKDTTNLTIKNDDAFEWIKKNKEKFDLIIIDMYLGKLFPKKAENDTFLTLVKKTVNPGGLVIFNRLISNNNHEAIEKFYRQLTHVFSQVRTIPTPVNRVFKCKG